MLDFFRNRLRRLFAPKAQLPWISESSTLCEIAAIYPGLYDFLKNRFQTATSEAERSLSLKEFSQKHELPPPQVIYIELQLHTERSKVEEISAKEASVRLLSDPATTLLDVRESWEWKVAELAQGKRLTPELFAEIVTTWNPATPIIVFCHFGIRSTDAATQLVARGFTSVAVIRGGIDSWSLDVDPTVPRYEGSWC